MDAPRERTDRHGGSIIQRNSSRLEIHMKRTRTLALTLAAATVVAGGVATQGIAAKAPG
jgi:hypothetical protein